MRERRNHLLLLLLPLPPRPPPPSRVLAEIGAEGMRRRADVEFLGQSIPLLRFPVGHELTWVERVGQHIQPAHVKACSIFMGWKC